jgi:signal transduction histidine kinase/ActR/RegA family two-component response regulator
MPFLSKAEPFTGLLRVLFELPFRVMSLRDAGTEITLGIASRYPTRSQLVRLHALVVIALSYQLLFSETAVLTSELKEILVLGLFLSVGVLRGLPGWTWDRRGSVEALVLADTAITTTLIYLSGNAASDLYFTYFLIILIAAFSGSLLQGLGLSLILCGAYAVVTYWGLAESEAIVEHHLMRIPMLVLMAVFHGVSAAGVRVAIERTRKLEQDLKVSEQFRHSQKMEAVGLLASGLAHDFNNMLTVIAGQSDLLLMTMEAHDPLRKEVEEIRAAADRAGSLTRQVLAFSRTPLLEPRMLDLSALVANLNRMVRRLLGEHIELVTVVGEKTGRVQADPSQLEQVIINLAINARDAMPEGGTLTLETRNVDLTEPLATAHSALPPGRYVTLAVNDTGIGMDARTQERIFEPFFTTKGHGRGTGLGLSTVYGIVRQSGGEIVVHSGPGRGSSFVLYLPRVEGPLDSTHVPVAVTAPTGSETILLVEDEEMLRRMIKGMLQLQGYGVLEAQNGAEAIRIGNEHQGRIDLVIVDVFMPRMNGRQAVDRLLSQRPDSKVLYISGYPNEALEVQQIPGPGTAILQKPFTSQALAQKVRHVLDGVPPATDNRAGRAVSARGTPHTP